VGDGMADDKGAFHVNPFAADGPEKSLDSIGSFESGPQSLPSDGTESAERSSSPLVLHIVLAGEPLRFCKTGPREAGRQVVPPRSELPPQALSIAG
jgi:hypothetical protein